MSDGHRHYTNAASPTHTHTHTLPTCDGLERAPWISLHCIHLKRDDRWTGRTYLHALVIVPIITNDSVSCIYAACSVASHTWPNGDVLVEAAFVYLLLLHCCF